MSGRLNMFVYNAHAISGEGLSDDASLRKAADEAVLRWQYQPGTVDGKPFQATVTADIISPEQLSECPVKGLISQLTGNQVPCGQNSGDYPVYQALRFSMGKSSQRMVVVQSSILEHPANSGRRNSKQAMEGR